MAFNSGQDASATLQSLFASLRPSGGSRSSSSSHPSASNNHKPHSFHPAPAPASSSPRPHPSVSNQSFAPPPKNVNDSSSVQNTTMNSPPALAGDQPSTDRTNNLLNLLKFGPSNTAGQGSPQQQSAARPPFASPDAQNAHGRGISASDLVGSFMGKPASPMSRENVKPASSANHQDALLKLLNRSAAPQSASSLRSPNISVSRDEESAFNKPPQGPAKSSFNQQASQTSDDGTRSSRKESPIRYFGTSESQSTPFEPQHLPRLESTPKQEPLFTYVNPFEQLAASSPRNADRSSPNPDRHKRKTKESTPEPPHSRRKMTPAGHEVLQSIESPGPNSQPVDDGRTQVEPLLGIGAPTKDAETVAEALNEVGSKVGHEAEAALANVEAEANAMDQATEARREESKPAQMPRLDALAKEVHDVASDVKKELDKEENDGALEEALPSPVAEALKDIIDDAAQDNPAEGWESDDGEDSQGQRAVEDDRIIHVYQFPLRPFVAINITHKDPPTLGIRDDAVTYIARLRKDFDQIDRTLATATNEFIVYASPKPGGIRIIRQDDGLAKHLFSDARDRVFNVSLSSTPSSGQGYQSVLATGVSGTVYWATIFRSDSSVFEETLDSEGLTFPPTASQADNVSGGQLKTRAKKSSRHPGVFAIGRGKAIHIISSQHAAKSDHLLGGGEIGQGNTLDMENYLKEHHLKILTGKAGKDFTFSEDDSVILSLDKSGRLKFWNVVDLLSTALDSAPNTAPAELKIPALAFTTASSSEKSWPTSVLFVDKMRAYTKGIAQRFVLVGMKQNHVLQLWDLCLMKVVQELNFPHEQETDAICSVSYHPASGIIVIGHPTRNSVYFVHLSAPKYNLPGMSQAKFIQRLANKDSTLPRPEATGIMGGMREYSFDSIGHIRSVDLVSVDESRKGGDDDQDPTLFELYVMHSRGLVSLSFNKADLGWSKDSKVLHPVDAEREKRITVRDLGELTRAAVSEHSSVNGDYKAPKSVITPKKDTAGPPRSETRKLRDGKTYNQVAADTSSSVQRIDADTPMASHGNTETKSEKKKKKKRDAMVTSTATSGEVGAVAVEAAEKRETTADPFAQQPSQSSRPEPKASTGDSAGPVSTTQPVANGDSVNMGISGEVLAKELKKIEQGVSAEFKSVLAYELETLYRRFDDDKRVQSAAGAAKQDAMLRLVSATLGENVEKSLSRIIQANIQQAVIPAIGDVAVKALDAKLSETITQQLHHAIPPVLKLALPEAVSRGVQSPDVLRLLSDQLTNKLSSHVDREFSAALQNTIMPAFQNLTVNVAQKVGNDTEKRIEEKLQRVESQHRNDNAKIDQLTDLVRGLSETVHAMAAAQSDFQQEILKLQEQVIRERRTSPGSTQQLSPAGREALRNAAPKTPEQEAIDDVASLFDANRLEDATVTVSITKLHVSYCC